MSIAAQCSDCCECPQPTVQWDSRSGSASKCGHLVSGVYYLTKTEVTTYGSGSTPLVQSAEYEGIEGDITLSRLGSFSRVDSYAAGCALVTTCSGEVVYSQDDHRYDGGVETLRNLFEGTLTRASDCSCSGSERNRIWYDGVLGYDATQSLGPSCTIRNDYPFSDPSPVITYSDIYTTEMLKANALAAMPAYDGDWDDTPGSFADLSAGDTSYAARESRYRIRFKIPRTNTGLNYRAFWVERFIPEAGVGITSVEVRSPGVYRPTVTLSAPPAGGTQARAVAVMSSTGTVASIRILNPGSGYTSAPTVTVQAVIAGGGGTSSTGWTATLSGGTVSAITGGSAGNYLPTLAFSSGGGSGATVTCTMDAQGGIASVSLGAAGSGYTSEPTLTITAKVSGSTAADLLLHLGTETARCAVWDGITPGGYNPATPSTYPIIGDGVNPYWSLAVPSSDGTTLVANLRAVCDGSPCP